MVETTAGRTSLPARDPLNCGPIGVTGCTSANAMAADADVVLAVGTRMQDFTTGSWTVFGDESARIIGLNAARFDATKHRCLPLVADAREGLLELGAALGDYRASSDWSARAPAETAQYHAYIDKIAAPVTMTASAAHRGGASDPYADLPTYAQVVGAVDRAADESTYVLAAAGGLPGELVNGWRAQTVQSFDCEYGYSCMGYEISGAWGAKMALPEREVVLLLGDGSYLMMNSDLYSTVLTGHKLIVIVADNGGHAVIDRLRVNHGGESFNNLFADCRVGRLVDVDFAAHAASMGCETETVRSIAETVERFAAMDPHLLKLPFPVDPSHESDRGVWAEACAEITERCHMPWTLLSGGGSYQSYRDQVEAAVSQGCAGFMAGRALWGEAALAPPAERPRIIAELVAPRLAELRRVVS